jgi:hypothetical protein
MSTQRYSVTPHPIETLLTWVKSGEIAIPEIQRPFVWEATKVRNLLDSLYQGYPVGYLIAWRNPTVKLKDGTSSAGKLIIRADDGSTMLQTNVDYIHQAFQRLIDWSIGDVGQDVCAVIRGPNGFYANHRIKASQDFAWIEEGKTSSEAFVQLRS